MKDIKARGRVVATSFGDGLCGTQDVEVTIRFEWDDARRIPRNLNDICRWVDVTIAPADKGATWYRTLDGELFATKEQAEAHAVEASKSRFMTRKQIAASWVRQIKKVGS